MAIILADLRPMEPLSESFADLHDPMRLATVMVRLVAAAICGGLLGYQRERIGKAAGLRTHMLISLGAAFFVLVPQLEGMSSADLSRIIQGIVTGVGFISAGVILKVTDQRIIKGLTTSAGLWLTCAIGIAAGVGRIGTAMVATALALIILAALERVSHGLLDTDGGENA